MQKCINNYNLFFRRPIYIICINNNLKKKKKMKLTRVYTVCIVLRPIRHAVLNKSVPTSASSSGEATLKKI